MWKMLIPKKRSRNGRSTSEQTTIAWYIWISSQIIPACQIESKEELTKFAEYESLAEEAKRYIKNNQIKDPFALIEHEKY